MVETVIAPSLGARNLLGLDTCSELFIKIMYYALVAYAVNCVAPELPNVSSQPYLTFSSSKRRDVKFKKNSERDAF